MNYLLDTNVIIGLLRGLKTFWDFLDELTTQSLPSVSAITRAEIYAGCHAAERGPLLIWRANMSINSLAEGSLFIWRTP